ncbi:MAG: glycoside hydrolase family 30 beta sandwich domain-containing protein [Gemmiger sp.]|nr:glycoside hydrolase family 30 beta sandwich domain-containing protein [Gemmiger sp.]
MKGSWNATAWRDGRAVKTSGILDFVPDTGQEREAINLHPAFRYQTFEGFGGALTEASAYVYSRMPAARQAEFLEAYFGKTGLGYTQARMALDSCDAALGNYSAMEDAQDLTLASFSLARDAQYILPFFADANAATPGGITVMLSPWSPPPFMKTNGQKNGGGHLKPAYGALWAEYFCRYIQEYRARGVDIRRISVQNEPKAAQTWDSCEYTAQEEKEFLRDYLCPALKAHGLADSLELYIWDHNKERALERALEILDEDTAPLIAGVAFHWYSGDHFEALAMLHARYPRLKLLFTEGCVEYSRFQSDALANARMYGHDIVGNLNGGACGFIAWCILFDRAGGPNHVNNLCEAPILYDAATDTMEKTLSYEYIGHFSRAILPGSVRIGMSRYTDAIDVTAFCRPDGRLAVVLMNRTAEEKPVNLRLEGALATLQLPGDAIATVLLG